MLYSSFNESSFIFIFTIEIIFSKLESLRREASRFDVFINGLFIREIDYQTEQVVNDFHIKFKRVNFPEFDRFGNPYIIDETDEVKINGDLEEIIWERHQI